MLRSQAASYNAPTMSTARSAQRIRRLANAVANGPAAARAWRLLLALLAVAVGYLALTPTPPTEVDFGWDKLNHVLAFFALAFSACLGYPASRRAGLLWLGGLLAYGGVIEVLQFYVPGRSSEWADLVADAVGIACGAIIAALMLRLAGTVSSRPIP